MPMKLDKETIIKHQFWFLLGGYLLFWLIAVMVLKFTAPGRIEEAKNNYGKAAKGVADEKRTAVNKATFLPPWEDEAAAFDKHKGKIWKDAWDYQWRMYDWPDEWLNKYQGMLTPQTPISTDDLDNYRQHLYPEQIKNLRANAPRWVEPVELQGGFDNIFKPLTKEDWQEVPTREEVWLAQEDIWVKRELLVTMYQAMADQALMVPRPIKEANPDPKNIVAIYRFANKNWEITLHLRPNKDGMLVIGGDSIIKNIHPSGHPQPLTSAKGSGIWFNVVQDKVRQQFEVRGEPVSWNETRRFSMDKDDARNDYEPLQGINWNPDRTKEHPILVSQGFDQSNCPIRRINAIELGQQDCRSSIWPLQPNHFLAGLDAPAEEANKPPEASADTGGGMAGGGDQIQMMKGQQEMMQKMRGGSGMMGGMGGGQAGKSGNATPNNHIERNRYLQSKELDKKLNPPSRHLPLAVQLIAEQAHMHDVLVALANSRLRFQITQVEFHHVTDYVPQTDGEKKGEKDTASPRNTFLGPMPGMGGGNMQGQMMDQMRRQQEMMRGSMGGGGGQDRMAQMQRQRMDQMRMMGGSGMMGGGMGPLSGPMMNKNPTAGGPGGALPGRTLSPGSKGTLLPKTTDMSSNKATEENQSDDNLVELTVYGIVTLYRFPDQPKPTEQQAGQTGGTPPADATQQTQTTAPPATGAAQPATTPATTPNGAAQPGANTTANGATPTPLKEQPKPAADAKQAEKAADKQPPAPPTPPPAKGDKR